MRVVTTVTAVALSLSACGGDGGDTSGPPPPATQLAFQVQPSPGTVGQPITPAVQVVVHDASGKPVGSADSRVTLAIATNPSDATLSGTLTLSAVGGLATFPDLRLSKAGTGYTLSATATGLASATSTTFDVSAAPGVATTIAPFAGDGQTAMVGQAVATKPAVKVTDGLGSPVANVTVNFSVDTTSGEDQTTDADGVATLSEWNLATAAGEQRLYATSPGLQGSPVTFTATATPGPAVGIAQFGGEDQIANPGNPVAEPPSVLVTDTYGNPVGGVGVTFTVASGGGTITGPTQVTGTDGVAAVSSWTLGTTLGPNTLKAKSTGLTGSPVTFHATAATLPSSATVEVHSNYFLSVRNGSGSNPTLFGSVAVDTIAVGGTVAWQWVDSGHNVTLSDSASGTQSAPFTFGPITFSTPGTYAYRCTIHSQIVNFFGLVGMRGRIVVR